MELVYKFFVQRTHLWVHQLLVNSQPHSKNVHLEQEMWKSPTSIMYITSDCPYDEPKC